MSKAETNIKTIAWQPLTPGGLAAFAESKLGGFLLAAVLYALPLAASFALLVHSAWAPALSAAIENLPPDSRIQNRHLHWPQEAPRRLADTRFLVVRVDLDGGSRAPTADLAIELRPLEWRLYSLFGYLSAPYPAGWIIELNREKLEPWWGAWKPTITAGAFLAAWLLSLGIWSLLALLYMLPVRLLCALIGHFCLLSTAWRVGFAAQWIMAPLLAAGLLLYSTGQVPLLSLSFPFALGLVWSWALLLMTPFTLRSPFSRGQARRNPFANGQRTKKH